MCRVMAGPNASFGVRGERIAGDECFGIGDLTIEVKNLGERREFGDREWAVHLAVAVICTCGPPNMHRAITMLWCRAAAYITSITSLKPAPFDPLSTRRRVNDTEFRQPPHFFLIPVPTLGS
jgi:hypothetical protein